ncbi:MAG: AAA family ATPase [Actinobacteria bacterium]|nr:AAA family ATPase [Actinomycetota bacterium]
MYSRCLRPSLQRSTSSVLLLGPRQVGKSTLMRSLDPDLEINLAHEPTFLSFASDPSELEARLDALAPAKIHTVFIDEIQRIPGLLNTIQSILDRPRHGMRFLLTGSSARKLRRGEANLLPGRLHAYQMGPIVSAECDHRLPTPHALAHGTLPGILAEPDARDREKTLSTYAAIYLREEVQAESLSRSLEGFARFLTAIGEWAGAHLDLAKVAQAAQVPRQSAGRWFEVLEDTLLVVRADAFAKSATRRLVQHPKFYFFDNGVLNGLLGNFGASPDRIGRLFEHLLFGQIVHSAAAFDQTVRVATFRTEHGAEVDFIVERGGELFAIEAKASRTVGTADLRGLARFADYAGRRVRAMVWYLGREPKRLGGVEILPWQQGLEAMGW